MNSQDISLIKIAVESSLQPWWVLQEADCANNHNDLAWRLVRLTKNKNVKRILIAILYRDVCLVDNISKTAKQRKAI